MKKMSLFILFAVSCLLCGCSAEKPMDVSGSGVHFDGVVDGVSQKGPFLTGSTVTLQELDANSLEQTGKSFKGKIMNDKGEFAIDNVDLNSPYALLVANGYFRNEVSGEKSSGTIILMAIADLSNRSHVNINLLTHLEYERIRVLLEQKKMSFADAKSKAEQEIFSNFFDVSASEKAENLNIFGDSEGDKALLAINVLLLGDLSEAAFMERLVALGDDFSRDGVWDDSLLKTEIADYACGLSMWGDLPKIREKIEAWKIAEVPAFETYMARFWMDQYDLGKCDASNVGEHKKNANKASAFYGMNFVCEKGGEWVANKNEFYGGCDTCSVMRDPRDGHVYKYVNIDGTDWMTSNLKYDNGDFECFQGNCDDYGYLYKSPGAWYFVNQYDEDYNPDEPAAGICPSGWRIPILDDLRHLVNSASEEEKKQLFSEPERDISLAAGAEKTCYWSAEISAAYQWRFSLEVYSDGSMNWPNWSRNTALSRPDDAAFFVRCVRN